MDNIIYSNISGVVIVIDKWDYKQARWEFQIIDLKEMNISISPFTFNYTVFQFMYGLAMRDNQIGVLQANESSKFLKLTSMSDTIIKWEKTL